jgi:hypothetical protein
MTRSSTASTDLLLSSSQSIRSLGVIFPVSNLLQQIEANPDVWNRHKTRLYGPHSKVSDVWVRYNAWENFKDRATFNGPHESHWYPVISQIPAVVELCHDAMAEVGGKLLGGVLITKIPPHEKVEPHIDGGWHAGYYEKFAIQLKGTPEQKFCFEDAVLSAEVGELYTFDNSKLHWVINDSDEDRMTLIICIRRH